jgi:hypothetical protein
MAVILLATLIETQLKLLALKKRELDESKTELITRSKALDVTTEALRINQLQAYPKSHPERFRSHYS